MNQTLSFWLRPVVLKCYLLLFCVAVIVVAAMRPHHIWDSISYTSLAKEKDFESIEALHQDAFDSLISTVGQEKFEFMLEQHHPKFRKAMWQDPEVFRQQLNFFRTRLLFNNTVRLLHKTTGIEPRKGGSIVAAVCAALGFWVMAMVFFKKVPPATIYLFPVLGALFGVMNLARVSSPDAMAFLFLAVTCFAFFRKSWWLLFIALPLAVAARTDAIVWAGLLGGYVFVTNKGLPRWGSIVAVIASYAVYKYANYTAGQYDWGVLIQNAFWEPLLLPAEADGIITASHYAKVLAVGLATLVLEKEMLLFLFLLAWFTAVVISKHGMKGGFQQIFRNPWIGFIVVSVGYIVAHFVLFPVLWYRFFVMQFLFLGFLFLVSATVKTDAIDEATATT